MPKGKKYQSGQALLIVLLSMAVVLTIVLSIISRTVTDVKVTSQDEESLRAFSAAEAGIEKALFAGSSINGTIGSGDIPAGYSADISQFAEGDTEYVYPVSVFAGESVTVWFVSHDENGFLVCDASHRCYTGNKIRLCWGRPGTSANAPTAPAIEASIFYRTSQPGYANVKVSRGTSDPNSTRISSNHFASTDSNSGCTVGDMNFAFYKDFNFSSLGIPDSLSSVIGNLQYIRVKFYYNTDITQPLGVVVTDSTNPNNLNRFLPAQGNKVTSSGTYASANRKIEVFQGYSEIPDIFENALFSPHDLVQ